MVGSIFELTEIDCEKDQGKVLTPEIDREIYQGKISTCRKDCKVDQYKNLRTDLRILEKARKIGQKDEEKNKKNQEKYSLESLGKYLT